MSDTVQPSTSTPMLSSCDFPYVLPQCTELYKEVPTVHYGLWQVLLFITGIALVSTCSFQLFIAYQKFGLRIQFLLVGLSLLASVTFIIRGIDPYGFGNVVPFLAYTCIELVCTCCITIIYYWIPITWNALSDKMENSETSSRLNYYGFMMIPLVCTILAVSTLSSASDPGQHLGALQGLSHMLLALIDLAGLTYFVSSGVRLNKAVAAMEKAQPRKSVESSRPHEVSASSFHGRLRKVEQWYHGISKVMKIVASFGILSLIWSVFEFVNAIRYFTTVDGNSWKMYNECIKDNLGSAAQCTGVFDDAMAATIQGCAIGIFVWIFWTSPYHALPFEGKKQAYGLGQTPPKRMTTDVSSAARSYQPSLGERPEDTPDRIDTSRFKYFLTRSSIDAASMFAMSTPATRGYLDAYLYDSKGQENEMNLCEGGARFSSTAYGESPSDIGKREGTETPEHDDSRFVLDFRTESDVGHEAGAEGGLATYAVV